MQAIISRRTYEQCKKNFLYNALFQILNIVISLITTPYVARVLKPEGVGAYSYGYSVAYYFTLFILLGLNNYGSRVVASVRDNKEERSKNFSNIYVTQLLLGLAVMAIYIVYGVFFAKDKTIALILSLYVASGIFDINWFFYGMEEFKLTALRNSSVKILTTFSIFVFVRTSSDLHKYIFIMAIGFLFSQLCAWPFVKSRISFTMPSWSEAKKHIKPNLILFTTTLAVSLFQIMDKIMLGLMKNETQVGFYESSEKVFNIPVALVTALGIVMLPRMTKLIADGKEENNILHSSLFFVLTATSALCFGIMSVSDIFVPLFYGEGYDECIVLFLILLPSGLFRSFANVVRTQYLLPHKLDRIYVVSAFIGAGVNLCSNFILIPHLAARGAAVGTLLAEAAVCFCQCFMVREKINLKKCIICILPAIVAGAGMFFVVRAIRFNVNNVLLLIAKIGVGCIVFLILFALLCIPRRKEYMNLLTTMKRL